MPICSISIHGTPTRQQLRSRAETARLGSEEIRVAHVDDLIAMKLRAGRPIDLQDIAAITGHEVRDVPPAPDRRS